MAAMRTHAAIAKGASLEAPSNRRPERPAGWYVRPALRAKGARRTPPRHRPRTIAAGRRASCSWPAAAASARTRTSRRATSRWSWSRPTFPEQQKLAKSSNLVITLRNAGDETIPNLGISVDGFDYPKEDDPSLADRSRPVFAANGEPVQIGGFPEAKDGSPRGCDSAYVNVWACGPLAPGREKTLRWSVTAVKAGRYKIGWRANAGLHGKARAVLADGGDEPPSRLVQRRDLAAGAGCPDRGRRPHRDQRRSLTARGSWPGAALDGQTRVLRVAARRSARAGRC